MFSVDPKIDCLHPSFSPLSIAYIIIRSFIIGEIKDHLFDSANNINSGHFIIAQVPLFPSRAGIAIKTSAGIQH